MENTETKRIFNLSPRCPIDGSALKYLRLRERISEDRIEYSCEKCGFRCFEDEDLEISALHYVRVVLEEYQSLLVNEDGFEEDCRGRKNQIRELIDIFIQNNKLDYKINRS